MPAKPPKSGTNLAHLIAAIIFSIMEREHKTMKRKLILLPILLVIVLMMLFSGKYVYLHEGDIMIVPNEDGNPTLVLDDGEYFVRYWNLASGCYKLTSIGLLDYSYATRVDESRCPVNAMAVP
jgi:hypothetical protein